MIATRHGPMKIGPASSIMTPKTIHKPPDMPSAEFKFNRPSEKKVVGKSNWGKGLAIATTLGLGLMGLNRARIKRSRLRESVGYGLSRSPQGSADFPLQMHDVF